MPPRPGIPNNPNDRPIGARNNRAKEIIQKLTANGFKDPLITLAELSEKSESEQIRATASQMLAPYLHGKMGMIPAPIYIEAKVHLPHPNPTKLEQVRENIIYLTNLKLSAQIDTATADNLILDQRHLHDSIFEELKLLYSTNGSTDVTFKIEGGCPICQELRLFRLLSTEKTLSPSWTATTAAWMFHLHPR